MSAEEDMSLRERIDKEYFNGAVGEVVAICRAELLRAADTLDKQALGEFISDTTARALCRAAKAIRKQAE